MPTVMASQPPGRCSTASLPAMPRATTETAAIQNRDGIVNLDEYRNGTHPRGFVRRYLADGVTGDEVDTRLALANAEDVAARVLLSFSNANGQTTRVSLTVPARSRRTVDASAIPELSGSSFSTLLESDQAVALNRLMFWTRGSNAATLAAAIEAPATSWHFETGSTRDPLELFYLIQNAGSTRADVEVRYQVPEDGRSLTRTYTVAPNGRATIWVDRQDAALAGTNVSADITSLTDAPIVVEQATYVTQAGQSAPVAAQSRAGTASNVEGNGQDTELSGSRWLLAEADQDGPRQATSSVLVRNAGANVAEIRITLLFEDGPEESATFTVAGQDQVTVPFGTVLQHSRGRRFSVLIESTSPAGTLVVERAFDSGAKPGSARSSQ